MARSISDIKKSPRRGRPPKPGGVDPGIFTRLPTDTLAAVDAYAEKAGISRSDAVRQLIEASLKKVKGRG
ncbi:ribbon-helix-helix domain-containing protein [Enhydrobacter sp.]|uniref:ribbon-helix-helix domain-containing protein n=1 Tax=Enhydrobacter sp. TaxID=1894999 RepID=UPI0026362957|nr:ribbon-helix-helix domain-containing protein [Enhydrobacter sp.]